MKLLFDMFFVVYGFFTLMLTMSLALQAFNNYPPYILAVIVIQTVVILVPYTLVWLYFRERMR